jgi:ATP-dependent DNA helicase RecQ
MSHTTLHDDLSTALAAHFGHDQFKPGQRAVMERLMAGRSAAAVFPTGGGKSLCYQLPALLLPGVTLVVSPLIALIKDQIDALQARGIAAQRLDSTQSLDQYRGVMDRLRGGDLRLLYVAPERFNNERFREAIARVRVSLFAVDEAHCISEWGHAFRPDYLKLAGFARLCRAERTLALTATATPRVLDDICRLFGIDADCAVRTGFYRSNLALWTTPTTAIDRDPALLAALRDAPPGPAIVYVTLQKTAEQVAARLREAGIDARAYHAGMEDDARTAVQDWFLRSDRGVVVATIAFGMGVDKPNIRAIVHYNLPKSLENYSQEIGRAGRDGLHATCRMLVCGDDLNVLENFVYGDTPAADALRGFVDEIFSLGAEFDVSQYELSDHHDIRMLVVRTLLTYLELDGYLEGGTPFYSEYQFKPRVGSKEMLSHFEGERREFLRAVFLRARKGRTWVTIDVDQAAAEIGAERDRIVRALDYLGEIGLLELKTSGVRHRYRRLRAPADSAELAAELHRRTKDREQRELARLRQVLELAGHDGCQASFLGAHFGEALAQPCGHCGWCLSGGRAAIIPPRPSNDISSAEWQRAVAARRQHADKLADPLTFTRFLCGVGSPRLTRARLGGDPNFGLLGHVPFAAVLTKALEA